MSKLADALRDRAKELGLTNAEVARRSGLNERRYGNYVIGRREPNLDTLLRLAEVLRTTPNQLLGVTSATEGAVGRPEVDRLLVLVEDLGPDDVQLIADQTEALLKRRKRAPRRSG